MAASTDFGLFGPAHIAILASIPVAGVVLAALCRRWPSAARITVGCSLLANEAVWWTWRFATEGSRFPEGLPLQLCDLSIWAAIVALFSLNAWACDLAYYVGIAGTAQAVLTPELWAPMWSYPTAYFFLAHGGVIAAVLMLVWSGVMGPRAPWRAFASMNVWALGVGAFNAAFGTNYMYLCRKPSAASLLDAFGPWPVYILVGEAFALAVFWAMYLPFAAHRRAVTRTAIGR
ncbi:MAG TPA: TIGR02206 family membrane protein [Bryobacteraceae bacterium]|nr:TIGR02206 family membrane protein [Bryobacteraceae bacterium]